jgi:hypothetical protein
MESTVYPFETGEYAFIAHIEIRNFGQTPAYDLTSWVAETIDVPGANPFDKIEVPSALPAAGIAYPHAGIHLNVGRQISTEDKEALRKREKIFFVWGVIGYTDAFKKRHHFKFRMVSGKIATGTGGVYELGPHALGYEAD